MWESPNSHRSWECPNTINGSATQVPRQRVNSLPYTLLPLYFILLSTLLDTLLGLGSVHFQPTLYVIILITCFLILTDYFTLTVLFFGQPSWYGVQAFYGAQCASIGTLREGTVAPLDSIPC